MAADRCPNGSVKIGRSLALRLLDWHGGAMTPTYAVGSLGLEGHCVSKTSIQAAVRLLRATQAAILVPDDSRFHRYSGMEKSQLDRLIRSLARKGS